MRVERDSIVLVELDPTVGHEQRGVRPCLGVSDPAGNQRLELFLGPETATTQ